MRLQEEQVKQVILSSDRDLREVAVYHFAQSFSEDMGKMSLAIQTIELKEERPLLTTAYN